MPNNSGATYEPGDRVTLTMSSFTLYAHWKDPECTLKITGKYTDYDSRNRIINNATGISRIRMYNPWGYYHDYAAEEVESGVFSTIGPIPCYPHAKIGLYHANGRYWRVRTENYVGNNDVSYGNFNLYSGRGFYDIAVPSCEIGTALTLDVNSGGGRYADRYFDEADIIDLVSSNGDWTDDISGKMKLSFYNSSLPAGSIMVQKRNENREDLMSRYYGNYSGSSRVTLNIICEPGDTLVFANSGAVVWGVLENSINNQYYTLGTGSRIAFTVPSISEGGNRVDSSFDTVRPTWLSNSSLFCSAGRDGFTTSKVGWFAAAVSSARIIQP